MEKLSENNPRFCAKYIRFVGTSTTQRGYKRFSTIMNINGEHFEFYSPSFYDFKIGDEVYIAKRVPSHHGGLQTWNIHQIKLPEIYWNYNYYSEKSGKEQRKDYKAMPKTWFGKNTYIVRKIK